MWQLCLSDKKQFIFKWGSWKFCCNERFGIWHGNIQGSYSRLWQCPYLCISIFTSSFSKNRDATVFFPPFVYRPVRGWPEALGILALDTFADLWLHSVCLWSRLFWQCHPVRSRDFSFWYWPSNMLLKFSLPALYSFPEASCWLLPPCPFRQVLMLRVAPAAPLH